MIIEQWLSILWFAGNVGILLFIAEWVKTLIEIPTNKWWLELMTIVIVFVAGVLSVVLMAHYMQHAWS